MYARVLSLEAPKFSSQTTITGLEKTLSQPQGLIQPLLLHHHEALFKNCWILDGLYLTNGVRDNGVKVIIQPQEVQGSRIWRSKSNIEQCSQYSAAFDYRKPITIISHRLFIQVTSISSYDVAKITASVASAIKFPAQ